MADAYGIEDYRAAARRAMEAGDVETARSLAQRGITLQREADAAREKGGVSGRVDVHNAEAPTGLQEAGQHVGNALNDGAPQAADVARSGASGLVRGTVALGEVPSLPGRGMDYLLARGSEFVMGDNAPEWTQRPAEFNAENPPPARALAEKVPPVNSMLEYEPTTTAGEYAQTVGEFVPGAMIGPGGPVGNVMRYGVAPGVVSEMAGQATEGTKYEPYARIAAALLTPAVSGRPTNKARPVTPRADPEDAKMAETLMRHGVRPTVGQTARSPLLRRLEGSADILPQQADDVTRAAIRTTGSPGTRAVPETLAKASDDIVRAMDEAVDGVSFIPDAAMAQRADDVLAEYARTTPNANIIPDVQNVADEIIDAATTPAGAQVSLDTLKSWRSRLGKLMRRNDPAVREAAYALRGIIDDATEAQLSALGRADDVEKLANARNQYRNWLVVADAATRAGAENGILSPTQLHQSLIRSQGRRNVAVGDTTELGELTRSSAGILRPEPTVTPGGVRSLSTEVTGALGGAAIGSQLLPSNPVIGSLAGALAARGMIGLGQRAITSRPAQSMLMDPRARIAQSLRAAPGAYAGTAR